MGTMTTFYKVINIFKIMTVFYPAAILTHQEGFLFTKY